MATGSVLQVSQKSEPRMVSVVMPVRNEEEHVGKQLEALSLQSYKGDWELVVVDNGSSDRTAEIARAWEDRIPALRVIGAHARRSANYARNRGAEAARGDFLACCDGDDVVHHRWLEALVDAAAGADLVGGRQDHDLLNDEIALKWCPWSSSKCLIGNYDFLPYAPGGNMGVWASVAREVGWDEDFIDADAEFSWRVELGGGRVGTAEQALIHRRLRSRIQEVMRQGYGYGLNGPLLYSKFRSKGMPRDLRAARWEWTRVWRESPALLRSRAQRGLWLQLAAVRLGRLVGSIRYRVFFP